jgi:hypothetical protein
MQTSHFVNQRRNVVSGFYKTPLLVAMPLATIEDGIAW